jgi:putative sugar O-methyltransferase
MHSLQFIHKCIDLTFRIRNYVRRKLWKKTLFSHSGDESDSQATFYQNAVSSINSNPKVYERFRQLYDYREILEHVDYSLGRKYLDVINQNEKQIWESLSEFRKNDLIGKPRTFSFEGVGRISPTTLRYVAVATDIRRVFGKSKINRIAEIGGGYGGQASILNCLGMYEKYFIFDLLEVQKLIQRYHSSVGAALVEFPLVDNVSYKEYDLVISNYAFSELPRRIQDEYLDKVILKSRRGFMLMNSGKGNITGRSEGKITLEELQALIPNLQELPEIPLTSPDNYLLIWQN